MNFTSTEYESRELTQDVSNMISVTLEEHEALYRYLLTYIAKNLTGKGQNLYIDVLPTKASPTVCEEKQVYGRVVLKLGSGDYQFRTFDGKVLHALHHTVGKPVGTDCGVKVMKRLVIFSEGSWEELSMFLHQSIERMETTEDDKFICYTWKIRYGYWDTETKVNKRPIASVVLPSSLKSRLVNDMNKFLDPKTKDFYLRNGIPYRRSYLFYGTPGTGKTSMVQALAAHFGRNVCFLMPTHPEMTDDNLRSAVNSIPENSIVVFEDIDALFDKSRSNQIKKSALTFSGLLNALDGIGSSNGQVFILTTNLRENLDHALIRNGRVDLHFEFSYAIAEQMELMWTNFYPDAAHLAEPFASATTALLTESNLQLTTAALQHYFVTQMDSTPKEALTNISLIVDDIRQNSSQSMLKEATVSADKNKKNKNKNKKQNKIKQIEAVPEASTEEKPQPIASAVLAEENQSSPEEAERDRKSNKKSKMKKNSVLESTSNGVSDETAANDVEETKEAVATPAPAPETNGAATKKKNKKSKKNKKNAQPISDSSNAPNDTAKTEKEAIVEVSNGHDEAKSSSDSNLPKDSAQVTGHVVDINDLTPLSKRERKPHLQKEKKKLEDNKISKSEETA
jgi:chaperone BCS1